jgi:hypothetical protein
MSTASHNEKYASPCNATNNYLFKYIIFWSFISLWKSGCYIILVSISLSFSSVDSIYLSATPHVSRSHLHVKSGRCTHTHKPSTYYVFSNMPLEPLQIQIWPSKPLSFISFPTITPNQVILVSKFSKSDPLSLWAIYILMIVAFVWLYAWALGNSFWSRWMKTTRSSIRGIQDKYSRISRSIVWGLRSFLFKAMRQVPLIIFVTRRLWEDETEDSIRVPRIFKSHV